MCNEVCFALAVTASSRGFARIACRSEILSVIKEWHRAGGARALAAAKSDACLYLRRTLGVHDAIRPSHKYESLRRRQDRVAEVLSRFVNDGRAGGVRGWRSRRRACLNRRSSPRARVRTRAHERTGQSVALERAPLRPAAFHACSSFVDPYQPKFTCSCDSPDRSGMRVSA